MHRERLQRAVDTLKALRPIIVKDRKKTFDLTLWFVKKPRCGTSACAMGWLALDPWFNRRGLSLALANDTIDYYPVYRHNGQTYIGFRAAGEFFNIPPEKTESFFSPSSYGASYRGVRLLDQVVSRIEKYLAQEITV